MTIDHVLAVVPVTDLERAHEFYARFFDRPADNRPMETLAEWHVTEGAFVQVFHDPGRAGTGLLNVAVDDLETHVAGLTERGIASEETQGASKGVRLRPVRDPDGNTITLIAGFRTVY